MANVFKSNEASSLDMGFASSLLTMTDVVIVSRRFLKKFNILLSTIICTKLYITL
jgi:hypothetical protein